MNSILEIEERQFSQIEIEDIRRVHSQINQIENQRFLIITVSLTLFGVFINASLPRQAAMAASDSVGLTWGGVILILFVLFLLFAYSQILTRMIFVLRTYLKVKKISNWEKDWEAYTRSTSFLGYRSMGYSKDLLAYFGLIGLGISICPILIEWIFLKDYNFSWPRILPSLLTFLIFLVSLFAIRHILAGKKTEYRTLSKWKKILDE